MHRKLTSR
ncbi:hypothetical protein D049_5278A, partial [Vibrio parahaemolyticus VPTS-2010]